ncbi:polyprenyl synthetase family protein [Patescibacteria group bacterium]|nr:polyprenyl synthetase family protein [Patescibacteria group bacterium]
MFEQAYKEIIERLFSENIPGFVEARDFCMGGGKRVRPKLLLDSAGVWGADQGAALKAALGIELLHHYLLVHDDIMDGDDLRRGQPTLHADYISKYGERRGQGMAIAVGDYLANEALSCFASATDDSNKNSELFRTASEITRQTILGQLREYIPNTDWTMEELQNFYAYKTAAYSVRLPWLAADILSGSKEDRRSDIVRGADELGVAYQFKDDLIEFLGEKKRDIHGLKSDLARGKMTVINRLILDALQNEERDQLLNDWKREGLLSQERVQELTKFAHEKGIPDQVQFIINERVESARETLKTLGLLETQSVKMLFDLLSS